MPSRIETSAGALAGTRDGDVSSFKGIPFAAPPVGDLRWRPPQPAPRWSGVRDATAYGSACMQKPGIWEIPGFCVRRLRSSDAGVG